MKKIHIQILISIITTIFIIIAFYFPIFMSNNLKDKIIKNKTKLIQYTNTNLKIIPEIINISKGYIIHNEKTLKTIIEINILAREQSTRISQIYTNQQNLLTLTNTLLDDSKEYMSLTNNPKFIELKKKFEELNTNFQKAHQICINNSNKYLKITQLPIYNKIINLKEISEYICIK